MSTATATSPDSRESGASQATAEITARICSMVPVAALTAAATGLAIGGIILARTRAGRRN